MFEVIIIGAEPAALAAAIYTAKNKLKTLVLAKEFFMYPKSAKSALLDYDELKNEFENQLKATPEFLELQIKKEITSLEKNIVSFSVEIKNGSLFYSKAIIIATGSGEVAFDILTLKNSAGKIKVDALGKTNIPGIFAVGSVTNSSFTDILTAAGQGATAALSVSKFFEDLKSKR